MQPSEKTIISGIYQHYKGKLYEVLGVCRHTETLEEMVVYKALYDDPEFGKQALWVRPKAMFFGKVKVGNTEVLRFQRIKK